MAANIEVQKPHTSATQLESYCRCPEAYRRRYLEGEVIPPGVAALKGKGFHSGAEANFRQKIESHADMPAAHIVEAAVESFTMATKAGYSLTSDEVSRGVGAVIGEAKDDLAEMVEAHATLQAPDYQPVLVEEVVRIALPNSPRDLLGIIDLADDQNRVTDFKTASKKKSQSDADDSVQLSVYAAAFHARMGMPPQLVQLDAIVKTKRTTVRQVVSSTRDVHDLSALAHRINAVTSAIQAGSFPPATPGAWWCTPKFCGYWSTCPYVNSHRSALAEKGSENE